MIPILLRIVMVALFVWVLWKVYTALYPARRPPQRTDAPDEWQDVLEAIDELPETAEPPLRAQNRVQSLPTQSPQPDGAASREMIESVIVREAEVALSLVREGDENERLAAYHEITIYEKLCSMTEGHISEATRRQIDDMHQQALEMICPPDGDY